MWLFLTSIRVKAIDIKSLSLQKVFGVIQRFPKILTSNWVILSLIWFAGALCDRIWFELDNSTPGWDQADYLTGTLNYLQALQTPRWGDNEWWRSLWLLSSKIPPLTYILGAWVQNIFGTGEDQATLVMLLFSAVLLASVFGLGKLLFNETVGLVAAGLCQILPGLYRYRLDFLLDYPLAAAVTLSFFCLILWEERERGREGGKLFINWIFAVIFGISLGLALLLKQTAIIFLFTPIVWIGLGCLWKRKWIKLLQLITGLWVSSWIFGGWYRTNWLTVLTSGKRATIDSAIAEGDAPLNTIEAWTFYWQQLPHQVSLPLLLIPISVLLLFWGRRGISKAYIKRLEQRFKSLQLPIVFLVGAYFLSSLNVNKDDRYAIPYLPVLSVFLAYALTRSQSLLGKRIRWGTLVVGILLMLFNLFPVGGGIGNVLTQTLSPKIQHHPEFKAELPHREIIQQITRTQPYLRSTLGVLPSTLEFNQHNLNYYGALESFRVYGRQVGVKENYIKQDMRSLSWFVTKTGQQGSVPDSQAKIARLLEKSPDFQINRTWKLENGDSIKLYQQKVPPVEVAVVEVPANPKISLSQIDIPATTPPGVAIPVTYTWIGNFEELKNGLVLLTWESPTSKKSGEYIIHDHNIGFGNLTQGIKIPPSQSFQVKEHTAMFAPAQVQPGNYNLVATYLNRISGESYQINVPNTTLTIDSTATPTPAPELDLATQFRQLAATLPQGITAIDQIFAEIGRINQYDPTQDYLVPTRLAAQYRLQKFGDDKNLAYTVAFTNILQRRVEEAIASLTKVTKIDAENPNSWAYLAFVQLYNFQPHAAEKSLQPALAKNPNQKEIKALSGVAALMQGNLVKAWQDLDGVRQ
ncbi:glycosyltransferase family 39 protein [Calothrix sp. PCC 6303]|nr:glycosyl transferase family 39 [Calothrix sp. PCC 6303]